MDDTKTKSRKNQSQITKDIRVSVPKNTDRLPLFLPSNPKALRMQIPLEPITHLEGGILERLITIDPWNDVNSKGEIVPKYLNTTTLEYWFWACRLWQEMPEPERSQGIVIWTRYELLRLMGKKTGGSQLKVHDDHITRLAAVTFFLGDCFFNSVDNQHMKSLKLFSVFSELELTELKNGEVVMLDKCRAKIHPLIVQNYLNDFTKPINLSVYSSIHPQASLARKLYTRLDTQFSHHDRFEISTEKFFRENGIFGKKYLQPANRKQNLKQAISQLKNKPFSSGKVIKGYKFEKTADGKDWKIIVWATKSKTTNTPPIPTEEIPRKTESTQRKTPQTSTQKPQNSAQELPTQPVGLVPIIETVKTQVTDKTPTTNPPESKGEIKTFLDTFSKLFHKADKEVLYRSKSIKEKSEKFINTHGMKKALHFLEYAQSKSKQAHFSKLTEAETPIFLINSKLGSGGLVNTWLEDRALAIRAKEEEKRTQERRQEFEKDRFYKEHRPSYDTYVADCIKNLSETQRTYFESYFQKIESEKLAVAKPFYKSQYEKSKLLQDGLRHESIIKFSKELLPKPVYTYEEWVEHNYPDEYKRFYS